MEKIIGSVCFLAFDLKGVSWFCLLTSKASPGLKAMVVARDEEQQIFGALKLKTKLRHWCVLKDFQKTLESVFVKQLQMLGSVV